MAIVLQPLCETEQIATAVQSKADKSAVKPALNSLEIILEHYGVNPKESNNNSN